MGNNYPIINWLKFNSQITNYFSDYQSAVSSDDENVVFERTLIDMKSEKLVTKLYITEELENPFPKPFLKTSGSLSQTRPACSLDGIVFNMEGVNTIGQLFDSTYTAEVKGTSHTSLPYTLRFFKILNN
jgi:hypothetical protein